jgi:PAS domain S-box-containing protein
MTNEHPMVEPRTRVVIADDDQSFREALADLISGQSDLELVGVAVDHPDAIAHALRARPDVVVLDARMPGGTAATTVRAIKDPAPEVGVLVVSAYGDPESAIELLGVGAAGYLVKGVADEEILNGIARTARGQPSMSPSLAVESVSLLRTQVEEGRRAEAATLHDVNVFKQWLERAPVASMLVGREGRIELANARARELFGYGHHQLAGEHITQVVREFQPGEPADASVARLANRAPPEYELPEARFVTSARLMSGAELPVEAWIGPLSGFSGVAVSFRSLSDTLAVESRYRVLFSSAPDATVVTDRDGTIQDVNAATERLFGVTRADVVGQPLDILLPGHPFYLRRTSDETRTRPAIPSAGEGLKLTGRRRDGTEFTVEVLVERINTTEGWLAVLSMRDVTKIVDADTALERSLRELRATNRKQRRTIVELIRSQERERMRVAAGIHDDSLQVITAAALRMQQMRRRLHDPDDLKILSKLDETITLAAERLRRMIFDYRPPALEEDGLAAALGVYLDQLQNDIGLSYELDADVPDPPRETRVVIYRIAQEALVNVRKHAHASRVRVRLSLAEGGYLTEVADDGVGIEPGREAQLSGNLGLALMRDRAEVVGGWFRIDSEPGQGTTVSFWVPSNEGLEEEPPE